MERPIGDEKIALIPQKDDPRKGGLKTMPFIIVNEALERVASYGLLPNMIFYLMDNYNMGTATGYSILSLWSALSNALAVVGAFLSDSFMGRFRVIAFGSLSSLLGMILMWLTAMIPQLRPLPCDQFKQLCDSATPIQLAVLISSFGLMSIGAGCIRPCSMAFGADQLDNQENPDNGRVLQSFFNWYYAATALSTILAMTVIVYIQDELGWKVGFVVPALLMFLSAFMFLVGSSLYVKVKASKSLFIRFFQVLVAAYRKRSLSLQKNEIEQYYHDDDSKFVIPSQNLRCLNKACIITSPDRDINPEGSASDSWYLCTVEQVESLKALLRVIPMWSAGILTLYAVKCNTFATIQAKTMNRRIIASFEIPAGSFTAIMIVTLTIWLAFYDRVLIPILIKHTGQKRGLSPKVRMGIGIILSCAAMGTAAIFETVRRRIATEEGLQDEPDDTAMNMSALWLVPQIVLLGLAEAFTAIGQIEFYYSQFPKSMSSIAVALFTLGMAVSDLLGSVLVGVVDEVTSHDGKESWLSNNLNKGHLDYYYWFIALLSAINFVYFLVCCWAYGPDDGEDLELAK